MQKRSKPSIMFRQRSTHRAIPHLPLLIIMGIFLAGRLLPVPDTASGANQADAFEVFLASPIPPISTRKPDTVLLANPALARRLQLKPHRYREIARIDAELDKQARQAMQAAIELWQKKGGFHAEALPNFRDPSTPCGRRLQALKRAAEEQISAILSAEEKMRWSREFQPVSSTTADKIQPAAL